MELLKEVLKEIKPSEKEEKDVNSRIKIFLDRVNSGLKGAEAVLGGSGAKGTWLSRAHDADIFVQFNYNKFNDKSEKLSEILESHLKKKFPKIKRLHGSRDYFQVKEKDFTFEIVPILKISKAEDAMNITDVSMLHAQWVKKHSRFTDEIRLTKQFCKANHVYGAESYINGFSGYICEILTIYYGSFINLVKAAAKWKDRMYIDIEKYYKNNNDIIFNLNKSKLISPLVIIDPVQKDRNAAAALSREKFDSFIQSCKSFLKKPSKDFFKIKKIDIEYLKKKAGKDSLVLIKAKPTSGKEDVVGCRLLKAFKFLEKEILEKDFKIIDKGWEWDKKGEALLWFIIKNEKLGKEIIAYGPPIKMKKFVLDFKKKYKKTFVEKGKIAAKVKREFTDVCSLLNKSIKDEYIKDKVKDIKIC